MRRPGSSRSRPAGGFAGGSVREGRGDVLVEGGTAGREEREGLLDGSGGGELGVAVARDDDAAVDGPAPPRHDADDVRHERERRVAAVDPLVDEVVAELTADGGVPVEGGVAVPEELVGGDHADRRYALGGRPGLPHIATYGAVGVVIAAPTAP